MTSSIMLYVMAELRMINYLITEGREVHIVQYDKRIVSSIIGKSSISMTQVANKGRGCSNSGKALFTIC